MLHESINRHGLFNDLQSLLTINNWSVIPNANELTSWAQAYSKEFNDLGYCFITQDDNFSWDGLYYEQVIYETKQIPTRVDNWHDLFNACIWVLFPKTKHLLNQQHIEDINLFGLKPRTKRRNAITLFDECGVIVAYQNDQQKLDLQQHQWQVSFYNNKQQWHQQLTAFMFGHANYEMGLNPFIGLTGKAYFVKVSPDFYHLDTQQQYMQLDEQLYQDFQTNNALKDNSLLSPMPFLGIPNWYDVDQNFDFYQLTDYFRPKRIK